MHVSPKQAGLTLGTAFAAYHTIWVVAMMIGLGRVWFEWVQRLHFVTVTYELESFSLANALLGIASAFVMGYVMGWIFGVIAQKTHSTK
ncbi:MAG: hypothetical protein UY13_C0002G0179 [Candidatus Pacebacteria bacterium GW2011_GWB1_47_8]|nr:MAG: hypothetical protein UX28_C0001G0328 [Candidatus Pacebacteria bacterium GW2011_GWA1_46_10]KKU84267.1 MAG: hypothetical protein UY13_C0002G0179 [Candidatus Pacebacteria bacterium GW2011_GWB1_47_8]HCR81487.1 hypothetical protein [Candidatus Paceibacterota bacterium]